MLFCDVHNEIGLVELDPFNTFGLELLEEGFVEWKELGEEGNRFEIGRCLSSGLGENEESQRTEDYRASSDSQGLGLFILVQSLVVVELELGLFRELRDDIMVVGVEPSHHVPSSEIRTNKVNLGIPFFHFGSRNVNTIRLATTTHRKEDIELGETKILIARGDGVERGRMIKHMVV
jgi:hypothetical protein